jgi:hypothetical protein
MEYIIDHGATLAILGALFSVLALVASKGINDYNRRQRIQRQRNQHTRNYFKNL